MTSVSFMMSIPSASCSFSSAARVSTTRRVFITSRALMRLLGSSRTPSMLRTDSASLSSGFTSTQQRSLPSTPSRRSISAAAFVLISPTRQRIDDDHRAVPQLLRQRRAQRALLDLLAAA